VAKKFTTVILYLDRYRPVEFTPWSRFVRSFIESRRRRAIAATTGGPGAVARTLLRQLEIQNPPLHWDFCFRDFSSSQCEVAWVVNEPADLEWAVRNRDRLHVRELWAGPNLVVVPEEFGGVLKSSRIDRIIVPTEWVADFYSDAYPPLQQRITIWPAAIETSAWMPSARPKKHWLVYNKYQDPLAAQITTALQAMRANFVQIDYGTYSESQFRELLAESRGLIWLSRSESQGIALLQALSMDVPALVWNPGTWEYYSPSLKQTFRAPASSAPYFSEQCGRIFRAFAEFPEVFTRFAAEAASYRPRDYIMNSGFDLEENKQRIIGLIEEGAAKL